MRIHREPGTVNGHLGLHSKLLHGSMYVRLTPKSAI